jgi:hypothetical protein
MTLLKSSLFFSMLSAALTAGGLFYFHQSRVREVRYLKSQNSQLRLQAQQRARAAPSAVVVAAPAEKAVPASLPVTTSIATASAPEYYRDEGNATPPATLQTFAWATDKADVAYVLRLLYLDLGARTKAEAFWDALPKEAKTHWKTVDEMAAAVLTDSFLRRPWPAAGILARSQFETVSDQRVRLQMPGMPRNGTEFQKTDAGWKYVLTESAVDAYIQHAREEAAMKR